MFAFLPVYRLLDTSGDAPFRQASVGVAEATLQYAWWGSVLVVLVAVLLAMVAPAVPGRIGGALAGGLAALDGRVFAVGVGLLAFGLSLAVHEFLYQGLYTNMDEIASAVQARYMARGGLAGPALAYPEGWLVTNTLMVGEGWVSQYPPSHLALMAAFQALGVPGWTGPVLMGAMAGLLALSFPRLLPDRPGAARMAAVLVALSPFLLFLSGGSLSHLTAGAAAAGVLYAALRARDGHAAWALAVGAAVGVMVSARPLIGLVLGGALPLSLWLRRLVDGDRSWFLRRAAATVAGGAPFALALALYNRHLFGGIGRFGYLEAFGANHELGFHVDPWGYMYGPGSAVAFTSIDLLAVGVQFFETPLPLTAVVGLLLLLGLRLPRGSGPVLVWALLPLLANAYYWFHDPRMMFEAAPAWVLLAVLAVTEIAGRDRSPDTTARFGGLGPVTAWGVLIALVMGAGWGIPQRLQSRAWTAETLGRIAVPQVPDDAQALVFVHASWNERLSARLQGAGGMRQDSIVSALRRNTNCQLHRFAVAREARARGGPSDLPLPEVDLLQEAAAPAGLVHASPIPGMAVRTREGEEFTAECRRELEADRFGAVALAPLLWQGDLPGAETGAPLFVRDMGPETNARIRALFPERRAFVFSPFETGAPPALAPYDEGMRVLWGATP